MDGLDICYQCVPYGATSEIEYSDGFSQTSLDFYYRHICERMRGDLDGLSWFRCLDIGVATAFTEFLECGVALGIGGLDALIRFLHPFL